MIPTSVARPRTVVSVSVAVLVLMQVAPAAAAGGPGTLAAIESPSVGDARSADGMIPVQVNTSYRATGTERVHAIRLTARLTPTDRTLRNTTLTIMPTDRALADFESVNITVSTSGGEQVVERVDGRPGRYRITRLEPGESVSIQIRLYPKALVPADEQIATVYVRTRFASNERIVETTRSVTANVPAAAVPVVEQMSGPQPRYVAGGLLVGILLAVGGFSWWWRSRRRELALLVREAADATTSREAERGLERVLDVLRVERASNGYDDSERSGQDVQPTGESPENADGGTPVVLSFDEDE